MERCACQKADYGCNAKEDVEGLYLEGGTMVSREGTGRGPGGDREGTGRGLREREERERESCFFV